MYVTYCHVVIAANTASFATGASTTATSDIGSAVAGSRSSRTDRSSFIVVAFDVAEGPHLA